MSVRRPGFLIVCIVALALRCGFVMHDRAQWLEKHPVGSMYTVAGEVVGVSKKGLQLKLVDGYEVLARGPALANAFGFGIGDSVRVTGQLMLCPHPRAGAVACIEKAQVKLVAAAGLSVMGALSSLKIFLVERLAAAVPPPAGAIAVGMLLGDVDDLAPEIVNDFRIAGVMHTMALSGYNVVIIIIFAQAALGFLPRRRLDITTLILIWLFVIMTGAQASLVRAALMGSLGLLARLVGRPRSTLRALLIAAFCMLLLNPLLALYDIGFQLSFAATCGLMFAATRIEKKLGWVTERGGVRQSLASTLAAILFTTPISVYHFRTVSLVAPLANIIVAPFVPLIMAGSFATLFFGKLTAGVVMIICRILLWMVHVLAVLPYAQVSF